MAAAQINHRSKEQSLSISVLLHLRAILYSVKNLSKESEKIIREPFYWQEITLRAWTKSEWPWKADYTNFGKSRGLAECWVWGRSRGCHRLWFLFPWQPLLAELKYLVITLTSSSLRFGQPQVQSRSLRTKLTGETGEERPLTLPVPRSLTGSTPPLLPHLPDQATMVSLSPHILTSQAVHWPLVTSKVHWLPR